MRGLASQIISPVRATLLFVVTLLTMVAAATLLLGSQPAQAQSSSQDSVMIVLDVSGSMNRSSGTEPGQSRLDVAKEALSSAVGGLQPGSIDLGLRTFSRCGTSLVVPLAPADPGAFIAQVDSIRAGGLTGIETALRAAVGDLAGSTGKRTIMLISDGAETCGGNPCAAAADLLANTGIEFIVNTVGFQTSGTSAEGQLQCIADATGGTMTPVDDLDGLFSVIDDAVRTCTTSLIECYAPEVRFHPQERYFPMDANDFVTGSALTWVHDADGIQRRCADDEVRVARPDPFKLGQGEYHAQQKEPAGRFTRECVHFGRKYNTTQYTRPFSDAPGNTEAGQRITTRTGETLEEGDGFVLEWMNYDEDDNIPIGLNENPGIAGRVAAPMYAQMFESPVYGTAIIYHMFYGFDPKARDTRIDETAAHEGDWERIIVVLNANDEPTQVRFEGHGCKGDFFEMNSYVPWDKMSNAEAPPTTPGTGHLVDGTHPVVYVAEGSHASYPYLRERGEKACPADIPGPIDAASGTNDETRFDSTVSAIWRPWEDGLLRDAQAECWYGFGGGWGDSGDLLSIVNRADDTGPAGPHWNINGLPANTLCGPPQSTEVDPGTDSSEYEDRIRAQLVGYTPNSQVVVSLASVEVGVAVVTIGADGTAVVEFTVPDGFEPGAHTIIFRDAATGEILSTHPMNIFPPPECIIEGSGASIPNDVDGDNLLDTCDRFLTTGPAADFDGDGVPNSADNCPRVPNADQAGLVRSPIGFACDIAQGHNAAASLFAELTGSLPGPGTPLIPRGAPELVPIPAEILESPTLGADTVLPPGPTSPYGFGSAPNPQIGSPAIEIEPAADTAPATSAPVQPLLAEIVQLPTAESTATPTIIAVTGAEDRQLASAGVNLLALGFAALGYARLVRRRQAS